jgi:endogenous inhibitor of DNA gyrase (YacG/DUF329 family)
MTMRSKPCPLCGKPVTGEHAPFCSRGCKDRDLLQWLGEGYRLPGEHVDPDDVAAAQSGLDRGDQRD